MNRDSDIEESIAKSLARGEVEVLGYQSVSSTMDVARSRVQSERPLAEFSVVFASQQTNGRGRRGRSWESDSESLYCTVISKPTVAVEQLAGLSLVVGIATLRMLNKILPGKFGLKWPNDVLAQDGRKLSGTLIELLATPRGESVTLIGVGLNCAGDFAPELRACSLDEFLNDGISPEDICARLVNELMAILPDFYEKGFAAFRTEWLSKSIYFGKEIRVRDDVGSRTGRFSGLGEDGTLLLQTERGSEVIAVGDVEAV